MKKEHVHLRAIPISDQVKKLEKEHTHDLSESQLPMLKDIEVLFKRA